MDEMRLRPMERADWPAVAELIYAGTNHWYQSSGKGPIFSGGPGVAELFCEVYEDLDPGCCILAENARTGRLMGSCFYHPRQTHVSLGIMNAHPAYFGQGVARRLLRHITDLADAQSKPVRLVSSAMNLDSFSLYTRAGFVPRAAYQDALVAVPPGGVRDLSGVRAIDLTRARPATLEDVPAIVALEREQTGISREKDWRYFVENHRGIWHVSVLPSSNSGDIDAVCASVAHPGSRMAGPGVARTEDGAAAVLLAELDRHRGFSPVFLVPVECAGLVQTVYSWGGRNCELHFHQVRGDYSAFKGVNLPTFMPETG
jgi:GNAT superfamily N-acetyltransferase